MKCKNCAGDLVYENGILKCLNCGRSFSTAEYFGDVELYICYLEADSAGRRTKDSIIAQDIYNILTGKKVNAFYKRISADEYSGDSARMVDDIAIASAKAVLLIGTTKENYKTLWAQYADRLTGKKLIPVYVGMNAYDIPEEINAIQALKYDNVGASADLIKSVFNALGKKYNESHDYKTLHKKSSSKRIISMICVAIIAIIAIGTVTVSVLRMNKTVVEENEGKDVRYNQAKDLIENGKFADAIDILTDLGEYKDSGTLLTEIFARYCGYYYDDLKGIDFHILESDDGFDIGILYTDKSGQSCSIEQKLQANGRSYSFEYLDNGGNSGDCDLSFENAGINLCFKNTVAKSEVSIPDSKVSFMLSKKTDEPFKYSFTINDLKQLLKNETTIEELRQEGHEITFTKSIGFEMAINSKFRLDDTDIYLITRRLGDYWEDNDNSEDFDDITIYIVEAPMSIVNPEKVGEIDDPYIEGDFIYYPNGSYSPEYGGLLCEDYENYHEITPDTSVLVKIAESSDLDLFNEDIERRNRIDRPDSFDVNNVISIQSSSSLVWNSTEYPPEQIADGKLDLAWQEGVEGFGEGEYIQLSFDQSYTIHGIKINAGYQKNEKLYVENGRPKEIMLSFENASYTYTLEDSCNQQVIALDEPVKSSWIKVSIVSVYEGTKYEDTAISEMSIF